ncbi:MAG: hypothetical protein K0B06_12155 [Brevefilum sp.]|nr:hypothetical protein [Brevefilum sp.]
MVGSIDNVTEGLLKLPWVLSCAVIGVDGGVVEVEVDTCGGLNRLITAWQRCW